MTNPATGELLAELAKLPPAVTEAYEAVSDAMAESFTDEEMALWAKEGVSIGTQTVRSWESAVEYYRVSPEVARSLAFASFMQWARCGTYLSQDSPTLAVAFFKASPSIVTNLRPQYIPAGPAWVARSTREPGNPAPFRPVSSRSAQTSYAICHSGM